MKGLEEKVLRSLGQRIREVRQEKGMTQEQLGNEAEITRYFVSKIENGAANPSAVTLYAIAHAMNIPLAELMDFQVSRK